MSRSKIFLLPFIFLLLPILSQAQTSQSDAVKKIRRPTPRVLRTFEMGVGFVQWGENIQLSQGPNSDQGIANYSGLLIQADVNWLSLSRNWLWGTGAALIAGQASSGLYQNGSIDFSDGVNRPWYGSYFRIYGGGSISRRVYLGVSAISRYQITNWEPADGSISVITASPVQISGEVFLKWFLNKDLTLMQSYSPVDLSGHSQWTMSAGWIF